MLAEQLLDTVRQFLSQRPDDWHLGKAGVEVALQPSWIERFGRD